MTRDAVFSLVIGCVIGVVIAGFDPFSGMSKLLQVSLGNADFIWVLMIEVAVGIMIAFYLRADVIRGFTEWSGDKIKSRRLASGFGWLLGIFIFFSDYFSPLFGGPIARPITDKFKVSREMLAYTLDSGSAPVCTLVPITSWGVYVAGLIKGQGPIADADEGMAVFIKSVPYNFYGWLAVILCGLIAFQFVPNFGPMKKAENRALKEGKVLRDGATPLAGEELGHIKPIEGKATHMLLHLVIPVLMLIVISVGTFFVLGGVKILEAFFIVISYQAILMSIGGYFKSVRDFMEVATNGIKAVMPAVFILALAYCINTISKSLGAQQFVIEATRSWMTPTLLPAITFFTGACISFFTGTSWGTYALLVPLSLPIAFNLSGGESSQVVLVTIASIMGGGVFGDHCSPVSDTSCLSSFGAASDHMDHVMTQLPYAFVCAGASLVLYLAIGMIG
jgi:Na+/H+ antiporter NhaC